VEQLAPVFMASYARCYGPVFSGGDAMIERLCGLCADIGMATLLRRPAQK